MKSSGERGSSSKPSKPAKYQKQIGGYKPAGPAKYRPEPAKYKPITGKKR